MGRTYLTPQHMSWPVVFETAVEEEGFVRQLESGVRLVLAFLNEKISHLQEPTKIKLIRSRKSWPCVLSQISIQTLISEVWSPI